MKDTSSLLQKPWLAILVAAVMLGGCGHIATYTDERLGRKSRTGILYYPPKPYVLVSRTGAKDKPIDVQVIYLPDLSKPRYAVMRSGYGSSKLSLSFSNGVLMSAGQETDPKLTEAITALAGIPGALANAGKTREETAQLRKESSDLPKFANALRAVATDVRAISANPLGRDAASPTQLGVLGRIPGELDGLAAVLDRPDATEATLETVLKAAEGAKKKLAEIKPGSEPVSDRHLSYWALVRKAESALDSAISEMRPKPASPPTITLYEVVPGDAGTSLREVPMSTLSN